MGGRYSRISQLHEFYREGATMPKPISDTAYGSLSNIDREIELYFGGAPFGETLGAIDDSLEDGLTISEAYEENGLEASGLSDDD